MEIRHSTEKDFGRIMALYEYARKFMTEHGNPNQWGVTQWPPESLIYRDITQKSSYVCVYQSRIVGTFFFRQGKDIESTYRQIEHGNWLDNSAYGVVLRLAGGGSTLLFTVKLKIDNLLLSAEYIKFRRLHSKNY